MGRKRLLIISGVLVLLVVTALLVFIPKEDGFGDQLADFVSISKGDFRYTFTIGNNVAEMGSSEDLNSWFSSTNGKYSISEIPEFSLVIDGTTHETDPVRLVAEVSLHIDDETYRLTEIRLIDTVLYYNVSQLKNGLAETGVTELVEISSQVPSNFGWVGVSNFNYPSLFSESGVSDFTTFKRNLYRGTKAVTDRINLGRRNIKSGANNAFEFNIKLSEQPRVVESISSFLSDYATVSDEVLARDVKMDSTLAQGYLTSLVDSISNTDAVLRGHVSGENTKDLELGLDWDTGRLRLMGYKAAVLSRDMPEPLDITLDRLPMKTLRNLNLAVLDVLDVHSVFPIMEYDSVLFPVSKDVGSREDDVSGVFLNINGVIPESYVEFNGGVVESDGSLIRVDFLMNTFEPLEELTDSELDLLEKEDPQGYAIYKEHYDENERRSELPIFNIDLKQGEQYQVSDFSLVNIIGNKITANLDVSILNYDRSFDVANLSETFTVEDGKVVLYFVLPKGYEYYELHYKDQSLGNILLNE